MERLRTPDPAVAAILQWQIDFEDPRRRLACAARGLAQSLGYLANFVGIALRSILMCCADPKWGSGSSKVLLLF